MFLFYLPDVVLIAAAVIPAIALLVYVYRQDRIEKEPLPLLGALLLYGIAATALAKVLERVGVFVVDPLTRNNPVLNDVLLYFFVVGFAEECTKYFLLKRRTWGIPEFNCRFDGVVYAVAVSLGFALFENIGYVFLYGLGTAAIRAVTAVRATPASACSWAAGTARPTRCTGRGTSRLPASSSCSRPCCRRCCTARMIFWRSPAGTTPPGCSSASSPCCSSSRSCWCAGSPSATATSDGRTVCCTMKR